MHTMQPAHIFPSKRSAVALMALLSALFVIPANGQSDPDDGDSGTKAASGQVLVIGGSVYGGGNEGNTGSNTTVTVRGGDINRVYGGARMANVGGYAFVNIDGENATSPYTLIDYVFGGNDISGTIGYGSEIPKEITHKDENDVDKTWNVYVRVSAKTDDDGNVTADNQKIYVGQLFGGGNGDYQYTSTTTDEGTTYQVKTNSGTLISTSSTSFQKPEIARTYLEIVGGSMVYAFGGGNRVTVTDKVAIYVNNPSEVVSSIIDMNNPKHGAGGELLTTERTTTDMALNAVTTYATSDAFQIGSFFGGNNKAEMTIQPTWNLMSGKIRNVYSGGNEGDMTSPVGLLLEISQKSSIKTDNIYGGCRKANVQPKVNGVPVTDPDEVQLSDLNYHFPAGFAARVLVRGGDNNNVYGGNDITGNVFGGTAVGIYHSIRGDVYGGGNGSYPYTDNLNLKDDVTTGDFYYNPGSSSTDSLYNFRPNVEQVWLRLLGTESTPTIIGGSVYVGGNSATILDNGDPSKAQTVKLQIGSYVIADHVFMGNNGENMIKTNEKNDTIFLREGVLRTMASQTTMSEQYNTIDLNDSSEFAEYMKGCAMTVPVTVDFDDDYVSYSTTFGSFFCGGNVGSMIFDGTETINFDKEVNIFEKVVGGCNSANVEATDYNAAYTGGFRNATTSTSTTIENKLVMNLNDLKIAPKRWLVYRNPNDYNEKRYDNEGNLVYLAADGTTQLLISDVAHRTLEWDTYDVSTGKEVNPRGLTTGTSTTADKNRRLQGGNVYGGCYNSGVMEGNVVINVNGTLVERNNVFDVVDEDDEGEGILYANDTYNITQRNSGVILDEQGMDVLGRALNVYGGGYGKDTEIWGSTTINLNEGYVFQVFGGAEEGVIGKKGMTAYDERYSTCVNLNGRYNGVSRHSSTNNSDMAEAEFIYGGGFEGPIYGDAKVYLGKGRIFNSFAGSCNADIYGHTETYVGLNANGDAGFPYIRDHIYGGNDLGGEIKGSADFTERVRQDVTAIRDSIYDKDRSTVAHAYMEYQQGRVDYIFGGCYGTYDYKDRLFSAYTYADGNCKPGFTKPRLGNAFVNFRPVTDPLNPTDNKAKRLYGAGQGIIGEIGIDSMQVRSYVLVDIPQTMTAFTDLEVFGAGSACGLGMGVGYATSTADPDAYSAVIDLFRGNLSSGGVYGGSYKAGVTRRTVVNVPTQSTIQTASIFGGSYGIEKDDDNTPLGNLFPCDVYEANVNYRSDDARVSYLYGGNNNYRRTLYGKVNIYSPVRYQHPTYGLTTGTVYGAGYGQNSWSQYTEVNLYDGATVYEAYGGGYGGRVLNKESVEAWNNSLFVEGADTLYIALGSDFTDKGLGETNIVTESGITTTGGTGVTMEQTTGASGKHAFKSLKGTYNTNVHIYKGASINNYCYGGGYGVSSEFDTSSSNYKPVPFAGDVCGTTYIDLRGGWVNKDLYGAGTMGAVLDYYGAGNFTASANVYIEGGQVRNVYGGGWKGSVGKHPSNTTALTDDVSGDTHVVIGKLGPTTDDIDALSDTDREAYYYEGAPAILRNVYGAGEGGAVYGNANLTINNGYVGYRYENGIFNEEVNDRTAVDGIGLGLLKEAGNAFGSGYADGSDTDHANVWLYGGKIRNSLYGGGEIGVVGRGVNNNGTATTHKAGETHVHMMGGHVVRDVFGGGRGYDNLNRTGELGTPGYVFGTTDVNIHYGTIGTLDGVADGYGNVFGGGNIGYVYSTLGTQQGTRGDGNEVSGEGRYYDTSGNFTEDVSVKVDVWGKATVDGVTVNGKTFNTGEYITSADLNKLGNTDDDKPTWRNIDQTGITIYNAVFAGGNVSAGSDKVMAFANTVYGNATASVIDTYSRDLISIGGDGVGGLYGDGNLTFVSGYRELNITNYGTDYYSLRGSLSESEYADLTPRQKSFYVTKYVCLESYGIYQAGDVIVGDEYDKLTEVERSKWRAEEAIINEGRYINTVQRCDFCGIKGSRLVLRGAIDRAQDETEADYTNYTINRVGELSLNQNNDLGQEHGCYFGIYNVVKYLGALTSDVRFSGTNAAVRKTDSQDTADQADGTTYYAWKQSKLTQANRNNGTSPNKVALASGVFLEIVDHLDSDGGKVYGPITGVVELDLLNVSPGEGGGYVYAKNIHGTPSYVVTHRPTLSAANQNMVTERAFTYATATAADVMETSGNFVHSLKRIVDDCFPQINAYYGASAAPAHYWYIRGEFYVYEQLVSAYTGAADAYSTDISIPLTMAIQGNARLRLLNVVPGLYANPSEFTFTYDADNPRSDSISIVNNAIIKTFGQGDPISYWDWAMSSNSEKAKFTTDGYYCNTQITVGGTTYYPGQAINTSTYTSMADEGIDSDGNTITKASAFKVLNEVSTDNGYVLTVDYTNPSKWDDYYTAIANSGSKLTKKEWDALTDGQKEAYVKGASFKCNVSGTYGQYTFKKDDIIPHKVYEMQTTEVAVHATGTQAQFENAYIVKKNCEVYINGVLTTLLKGTPVSASDYQTYLVNLNNDHSDNPFDEAYVCVTTVQVTEGDFRVLNELVSKSEWADWSADIKENFQKAYYCTTGGSYGGKYYEAGKNYQGIDYCQLSAEEREPLADNSYRFTFNYDAFDALLYSKYDPEGDFAYNAYNDYTTYITQAGSAALNPQIAVFDNNVTNGIYAVRTPVDYTATYNDVTGFTYVDEDSQTKIVSNGTELTNTEYENLPNDRRYYAKFAVSDAHKYKDEENLQDAWGDDKYHIFIVKETFDVGGTMYNAGKAIRYYDYSNLSPSLQNLVEEVILDSRPSDGKLYFCINDYQVGQNDGYVQGLSTTSFTDIYGTTYNAGATVHVGTIIDYDNIARIPNYQLHFDISGETPVEEATLYVPATADIEALQKDRYVTAIYEYSYTECDAEGFDYETRVEKHIINIRVKFLSGNPIIGQIEQPDLILPLEQLSLEVPVVTEGAFPILSGGWEIYANEADAQNHRNGRDFRNNIEQLYYYQDTYRVAYYAETRLGRTFSNNVEVRVANYQRMADVITDPNHMYINHRDNIRDPKIYIDGRSYDTNGSIINDGTTTYANELDAMKGMWNIVNSDYGTAYSDSVNGNSRDITGARNLDFILQGDVTTAQSSWTPIGDNSQCFGGRFHGNGHYVSGLSNSLFGNLCGEVYNTGVMGTFTSGGIANTGDGRVENCWVWTTGTPTTGTPSGQAVYGTPESQAAIVNCYYPVTNAFTTPTNTQIKSRTVEDFVNGSVAYDLNRFYLEARYRLFSQKDDDVDNRVLFRMPDGTKQQAESTTDPGTMEDVIHTVSYPSTEAFRTYGTQQLGYVERYYADGDFRYADGLKPTTDDMRYSTSKEFLPLYPDDYIFFGQKLTYGLYANSHATHPQAAAKSRTTGNSESVDNSKNGLLINDPANQSENRVYRAPAYFRNGDYGRSVMFNANAAFADSYTYTVDGVDYTSLPHHDMTAIDFTGGNGDTQGYQGVVAGTTTDFTADYKPLLDFERLDAIVTTGLTQNLLAYTPKKDLEGTKNQQTYDVLTAYFADPEYAETNANYRNVAVQNTAGINGHVVLQASTTYADGNYSYQSQDDHLLVDRQDFNAPMAYTFDNSHRAWYQRQPDNYAEGAQGWEGVSLPFSAELVTTQDKGEQTHFYKGSITGHEYWLREYKGIASTDAGIATAKMNYPDAGSNSKAYNNTFLYDYYYSKDEFLDLNNPDEYQKVYYNETLTYSDYPYSVAGQPYIAGFPGQRYYEFDLSGLWTPQHRVDGVTIASPGAQVITFASATGASIAKSDSELDTRKTENTHDGYSFTPSYLNTEAPAGSFVLNAAGSSFDVTTAATTTVDAFRPYFTGSSSPARRLVFGKADTSVNDPADRLSNDDDDNLVIYAQRGSIVAESLLKQTAQVRIVNANGILLTTFTIEPGQTVVTPVSRHGIYIAGKVDGRAKKLWVETR